MMSACTDGPLEAAGREIDCFASLGLRTLTLGYKTIRYVKFSALISVTMTA